MTDKDGKFAPRTPPESDAVEKPEVGFYFARYELYDKDFPSGYTDHWRTAPITILHIRYTRWARLWHWLRFGARMNFTCWFSRHFWDIHDYPVRKGGDGIPSHFYTYKCWNCGKEFGI